MRAAETLRRHTLVTAVASSRDVLASHPINCCCVQQRRGGTATAMSVAPAPAECGTPAPVVEYTAPAPDEGPHLRARAVGRRRRRDVRAGCSQAGFLDTSGNPSPAQMGTTFLGANESDMYGSCTGGALRRDTPTCPRRWPL